MSTPVDACMHACMHARARETRSNTATLPLSFPRLTTPPSKHNSIVFIHSCEPYAQGNPLEDCEFEVMADEAGEERREVGVGSVCSVEDPSSSTDQVQPEGSSTEKITFESTVSSDVLSAATTACA